MTGSVAERLSVDGQMRQAAPQPLASSTRLDDRAWAALVREAVPAEALQIAIDSGWGGVGPVEHLLRQRLVSHDALLALLGRHFGCAFVNLRRYAVDAEAVAMVGASLARRLRVLPLFRLGQRLHVAMADPMDLATLDFLRCATGCAVEPVLALPADIDDALRRHYLDRGTAEQAIGAIAGARAEIGDAVAPAVLPSEDEDAPTIRLINYVLTHAIELNASDIHFEPYTNACVLRFRVDGILHDFPPPPLDMYPSLVSRIKVMASLDIAERRLPQDGRLSFEAGEQRYDLRVSVIPGVNGENVVIRVLDAGAARGDVSDLGFDPILLARWERLITLPYGMILVTGPTGSGKSTTLYTTLRRIYSPCTKIITLEDPVECKLHGVTQLQISAAVGFTFAQGLRAVLRHDPDVIMLGEIRDQESAEIALRSSLTGHLLFSTLHTNDALQAVTRLVDMGIPPFLVQSSLSGVLAQRLVRRLCPDCRVPHTPDAASLRAAGVDEVPADARIFRAMGCQGCGGLGYKGRVGIYQLFEISPAVRHLSPAQLTAQNLLETARLQTAFRTLRESARDKLFAGLTSLEEVARLTVDDVMDGEG